MNARVDHDSRVADLEAFAGIDSAKASSTMMVPGAQSTQLTFQDRVVGAQPVAVHRDEQKVLKQLKALGAAAGDDWFYRFPVKNRKKGTTEYIEGPSIKLANDLARIYGNCDVDTRVMDLGTSWLIYARFNDYETGFSLTRPFQQQKGGSRMGGDDDARRLDIAFQIGVSKAIRNVVVNALQTFADYAFDSARSSIVEKIGKDIEAWRKRTVQGIDNLGVDLVRVELVVGKAAKDWTAPDIARVIALMKGIADGMSTIDETFPPKEKTDSETGEVLTNFVNNGSGEHAGAEHPSGHAAGHQPAAGEDSSAKNQETQASQTATPTPPASAAATEGVEAGNGYASDASTPSSASQGPSNDAEYRAYATAWIAEQTEPEECRARYSREKGMREAAKVTDETRADLEKMVKGKVSELKKG